MPTQDLSYLNPAVSSLRPSATLAINERSMQLIAQGKKVYRLGFGQSPFPVPPSVVAALQAHAHEKDYLPVKGLPALRKLVADFYQRKYDLEYTAEDVLIGPGSKELIYQLQLATDTELLLPSPSWVSYAPQAHLVGKKVHWISTEELNHWCLTATALQTACERVGDRPKLLILNYPNNPTGTTYDKSQLQELANVARKYNLLVVADEIYGEVHHRGAHHSLASFYPEGTIVSSGLSKWCGAGGWRLGTFCFPNNLRSLLNLMATIASETFTSVSAPIQYAAVAAYQDSSELTSYLNNSRRILDGIAKYVHRRLSDLGITMPLADGGFYLFPNFSAFQSFFAQQNIQDSVAMCEWLLNETGVALLPGEAFGRPPTELTARLSFVDFDGKKALMAMEENRVLTDDFIETYCPNISGAIDQLQVYFAQVSSIG